MKRDKEQVYRGGRAAVRRDIQALPAPESSLCSRAQKLKVRGLRSLAQSYFKVADQLPSAVTQ